MPVAPVSNNSTVSPEIDNAVKSCAVKAKEHTQKRVWILTYCPATRYITMEMLKTQGIIADECHSTNDGVVNYTYLHLEKRCRIPAMQKFFTAVRIQHGIMQKEIFGYESIGVNSKDGGSVKIQNHIAFEMLLAHARESNPSFSPCTDGEPVLKRGQLFLALQNTGNKDVKLEYKTKNQVIQYAKMLEEKVKELESKLQTTSSTPFTMYHKGKPVAPTTLGTLLHYRRHGATRKVMRRVARWEERLNVKEESQLTSSHDGSGEIYAAWNSLMPSLYKKGFSFKDAATRVRALQTAGVLEPFKLVRHARVPDAR